MHRFFRLLLITLKSFSRFSLSQFSSIPNFRRHWEFCPESVSFYAPVLLLVVVRNLRCNIISSSVPAPPPPPVSVHFDAAVKPRPVWSARSLCLACANLFCSCLRARTFCWKSRLARDNPPPPTLYKVCALWCRSEPETRIERAFSVLSPR
jgi:hypothetical protein